MATKSVRAAELEQAILGAIQTLDDADGSRTGMITGIDNARVILTDAYGIYFEREYADFNGEEFDDEDDDEDEDEIG